MRGAVVPNANGSHLIAGNAANTVTPVIRGIGPGDRVGDEPSADGAYPRRSAPVGRIADQPNRTDALAAGAFAVRRARSAYVHARATDRVGGARRRITTRLGDLRLQRGRNRWITCRTRQGRQVDAQNAAFDTTVAVCLIDQRLVVDQLTFHQA